MSDKQVTASDQSASERVQHIYAVQVEVARIKKIKDIEAEEQSLKDEKARLIAQLRQQLANLEEAARLFVLISEKLAELER